MMIEVKPALSFIIICGKYRKVIILGYKGGYFTKKKNAGDYFTMSWAPINPAIPRT